MITIDWGAFLLVFVSALAGAVFLAATAVVLGLYLYSKRGSGQPDEVLSHDVADAGFAVDVETDLPPTPRQARAHERRRIERTSLDSDSGKEES